MNRQPKGTTTGGQFAPSENAESNLELVDVSTDSPNLNRWTVESKRIGDFKYGVSRLERSNGTVHYMLTNMSTAAGGGGWKITYDKFTRRADVKGVVPSKKTAEWRDRGEVDIRTALSALEPEAQLFELDRDTYLVYGPSHPLSSSHLSGINSGQMMLTGGNSEDELFAYVDQERTSLNRKADERPDLMTSIEENRRYVAGIEIAARMGRAAAEANTVGAMSERGLFDSGSDT